MDTTVDIDDGEVIPGVEDHPTAGVVDIVTLQAVSLPEGIVSVGIVQLAEALLPLPGGDAVADELAGDVEKGADQYSRLLSKMPLGVTDAPSSPHGAQTVTAA